MALEVDFKMKKNSKEKAARTLNVPAGPSERLLPGLEKREFITTPSGDSDDLQRVASYGFSPPTPRERLPTNKTNSNPDKPRANSVERDERRVALYGGSLTPTSRSSRVARGQEFSMGPTTSVSSETASHQSSYSMASQSGQSAMSMVAFMTRNVRRTMLRGVRVERVMSGCGTHWKGSVAADTDDPGEEYKMSEVVSGLNEFLSHDWGTGRVPKFLALCIHYNCSAAIVASSIVVLMCFCLVKLEWIALPSIKTCMEETEIAGETFLIRKEYPLFFVVIGFLVFVFFFFTWRHIKSWLLTKSPHYVFVDKFCIHQTDEKQKKEGIMSLAGFLQSSERMVILWSTRYFSRLWCAYEVASWLHLGRDFARTVDFVPIGFGFGIVTIAFSTGLMMILSGFLFCWIEQMVEHDLFTGHDLFATIMTGGMVVLSLPRIKELAQLPQQLKKFSIQTSECFCCHHNHRHPDRPKRKLACDRELVYSMLFHWYNEELMAQEAQELVSQNTALEHFNVHMRTEVRSAVTERGRIPVRLHYQYLLMVVIFGAFGAIGKSSALRAPLSSVFRFLSVEATNYLCFYPLLIKLITLLIYNMTRRGFQDSAARRFLVVVVAIGISFPLGFIHTKINVFALNQLDPSLQLVVGFSEWLLAIWTFYRPS